MATLSIGQVLIRVDQLPGAALRYSLYLLQPYLLLRLLRHFRHVPAAVTMTTGIGALVVAAVAAAAPQAPTAAWGQVSAAYAGVHAFVMVAFVREAMHTRGVTARRLALAATGMGLAGTRGLLASLAWTVRGQAGLALASIDEFTTGGAFMAYYFAFATPRRLAARWQGAEQASYLSRTAEFDAEERGRRVPQDLSAAAMRSVGNSLTLVALRPQPDAAALVVRAASAAGFVGTSLASTAGALSRSASDRVSAIVPPAECDAELTSLSKYGTTVLVAPIATNVRSWGVVAVVQRRGSLFPDDDLRLLEQLGRHAGIALDHAQLIHDARERARRAADRRLREVEWRMSLMLDSIKDYAMFVLDEHGKIVVWHLGAQHVFGYTSDDMIDEPADALYDLTPEAFGDWLQDARRAGRSEREGTCRRKDGGTFIGATVFRPLEDDVDGLPGFVAVTRDVTEHRDLEARLRQGQKMEAIGQLAGGIAHDFNNILTAIIGYAEFLKLEFEDVDELSARRVREILTAAQRGAGLTRQLLQFSRRQLLEQVELDLSSIIRDMLAMLRRLIGEQITIVDEIGSNAATVLGDRSQVEQIIVNLAANARDAMPSGGRLIIRTTTLWLDTGAAGELVNPGPYALLEVADSGIGMNLDTQSRIFEPFFTTKPFGRGTGLGLSTVYGIVKQMAGFIRVASQPGAGSTFRLYFPVARPSAAVAEVVAPRVESAGTETLLVVEDEPAVRSFLVEVLEKHGYRVLEAADGAAALALVQAHRGPIDLTIADVMMPGGTGPDLVRALARLRPGVPALYISGYADGVLAQEGGFPDASSFLQKPFSSADLLARIRLMLERTPVAGAP